MLCGCVRIHNSTGHAPWQERKLRILQLTELGATTHCYLFSVCNLSERYCAAWCDWETRSIKVNVHASRMQGVFTRICAILTAYGCNRAWWPCILWKWVWLTVLLRILQKSYKVTVEFCRSHRVVELFQWGPAVTTYFRQSQIVTPVTAISIVHIGVTAPCTRSCRDY